MDKITLKNMAFYGYHGVLKEESVLGQKFFLDVVLSIDLQAAGTTDNVHETVSYADVYEDVRHQVEDCRYYLLEALAENIAQDVLSKYGRVCDVEVAVRKPEAPVKGVYDYFEVNIRRSK